MSNIGFIGLGIMGRPVAGHLITSGHKLFVHDALDRPAGPPKRLASRSSSSSRSRSSGCRRSRRRTARRKFTCP